MGLRHPLGECIVIFSVGITVLPPCLIDGKGGNSFYEK